MTKKWMHNVSILKIFLHYDSKILFTCSNLVISQSINYIFYCFSKLCNRVCVLGKGIGSEDFQSLSDTLRI